MSIWTQVFVVNLIIFITYAFIDRGLFNDKIEKWFLKGKIRSWVFAIYIFATVLSIPAWLIYLVIA